MPDLSYINIGTEIDASLWDSLYQELDRRLTRANNSQSLVLAGDPSFNDLTDPRYTKRFYFGDRTYQTNPTASLSAYYLSFYFVTNAADTDPFLRLYDHTPFTNFVSSCTLYSPAGGDPRPVTASQWPVALINPPNNAFVSSVWPDTTPSNLSAAHYHTLFYSLEAHKHTFVSQSYYVGINLVDQFGVGVTGEPEHFHPWDSAEIIVAEGDISGQISGGTFTWPTNWDKYRFFRFNNLRSTNLTLSFTGGLTVVIPPGTSRCIRRDGTTWTAGYTYFHKILKNDPWLIKQGKGDPNNNLSNVLVGGNILTGGAKDKTVADFSKCQDISSYYANPVRSKGTFEFPMPTGSWFPSMTDPTVKLGDLLYHKGIIECVSPNGVFRINQTQSMTVGSYGSSQIMFKEDGTRAFGVDIGSVQVISASVSVASTNNWSCSVNPVPPPTGSFNMTFFPGVALHTGDPVDVHFSCLTDVPRWFLKYTGVDSLPKIINECGLVFIRNGDSSSISANSGDDKDLIDNSTNFIWDINHSQILGAGGTNGAGHATEISNQIGNVNTFSIPVFPLVRTLYTFAASQSLVSDTYYTWHYDSGINQYVIDSGVTSSVSSSYIANAPASFANDFDYFSTVGNLRTTLVNAGGNYANTAITTSLNHFGTNLTINQTLDATAGPLTSFNSDTYFNLISESRVWSRNDIGPLNIGSWTKDDTRWFQYYGGWSNYGWPKFGFDLDYNYPRFNRYWQSHRWFYHDPLSQSFITNDTGTAYSTTELPLINEYYENQPFLTQSSDLASSSLHKFGGTAFSKSGIAILGQYTRDTDMFARLGAWNTYGSLVYTSDYLGTITTQDFSSGSAYQGTYYTTERTNILAQTPDSLDDIGPTSLPFSVEQYNSLAGTVNACVGVNDWGFASGYILDLLQTEYGIQWGPGTGYIKEIHNFYNSNVRIRPKTQGFCWNNATHPETATFLTSLGATVLNTDNFPAPWSTLKTTNQAWYEFGSATITENIGAGTINIADYWVGTFVNTTVGGTITTSSAANNFSWITVADSKMVCSKLGCGFPLVETVIPCDLVITNASIGGIQTNADPFDQGITTTFESRAFGWIDSITGSWVMDIDVGDEKTLPFRSDTTPQDWLTIAQFVSAGTPPNNNNTIWRFNFGPLEDRFYQGSPIDNVTPDRPLPFANGGFEHNQYIAAHSIYLHRNCGADSTDKTGTAIIYPRNLISFLEPFTVGNFYYWAKFHLGNRVQTRVADTLEGDPPVFVNLTGEEAFIHATDYTGMFSGGFVAGILAIVPEIKKF